MSDDIINFFEKQIKLEHVIVDSVKNALNKIDNEVVSSALSGISLDSMKHAMMYRSAISLLSKTSVALTEEQLDIQKKVIEKHIKMEEAIIEKLEARLPFLENVKVELLVEAILLDERRHHKLLKTLLEILVRGETVTEEDWWDAIWGDVPGLWG
jgi:rubrerythrin